MKSTDWLNYSSKDHGERRPRAEPRQITRASPVDSELSCPVLVYPAHAKIRKLAGRTTRKLSVTKSQNSPHFLGTSSRRNPADEGVFEEASALLSKLKSSHTNFYATDVNSTRPQHVIGATLRSVIDCGSPHWMFLDVFEDGPAARAGVAPGQLLVSVDETPAIPPAFPVFRFGQDHRVTTKLPGQQETRNIAITVPQRKIRKGRPPLIEPKSVSHRMLTPRVGLLRIPFFPGSFGIRF